MLARLLLIFAFIHLPGVASAHPAPYSYLDLHLDKTGLRGAWVIHDFDAAHELGLDPPGMLLDPAVALAQHEALTRLIAARFKIEADARRLTPQWEAMQVLPERQSLRLPFRFDAGAPGKIDIDALLFPYDANHQSFINIYEDDELKLQVILDARHHALSFYSGSLQGRWAVVSRFVQAGIHHILIGPDHILFVIGLLLFGGTVWRLAAIVTAFTLGHSVTLSLAALGLVRLAPQWVEPAIALSIVVVGVDNLLVRHQRRSPSHGASPQSAPARDLRSWLAMAFGLIHGFGFAAVLLEFGLPRSALGWSLVSFNVGVEIGQLMIVIVMAALLAGLRRRSAALAERFAVFGSMAVIAAGIFWFVQRIGFTSAA